MMNWKVVDEKSRGLF